jgi:uncharacterized protein (DUF2225 family)
MIHEDSMSAFYSHFHKTYLAEGIVHNQKCLVVDNDVHRNRDFWLKFLPAVAEIKQQVEESKESKEQLKVAWRYNDLPGERPNTNTTKPSSYQAAEYKYDSARSMGTTIAN